MRRVLLIALLVFTLLSCTACGREESSAVPAAATADEAATTREPKKAVATRPSEGETTTAQPTTEATTAPETTEGTTAAATTRPDPSKIPADNITSGNINPNLGNIQNQIINELSNLQMRELKLDHESLVMNIGETVDVSIQMLPSNCTNKSLTGSTTGPCATAIVDGNKLKVIAEQAGDCVVSLQSDNGLVVDLAVTVLAPETEPVETEAESTPAPVEQPTEE